MLLPAEIESKTLIPALRAILAKKLAEEHNIREDEISKMLGVTQAAVSNYIRGTRGDPSLIMSRPWCSLQLLAEEQVAIMIDELSDSLSSDMAYTPSSLSKFIGLCNYIKSSLFICEIHHNLESNIDEQVAEEQVAIMIDELSDSLSSDMAYTPSSLSKFIGLCNYIKSSLFICEIHHNLESNIDEQVCKECENMLLKGPGSVY